MLDAEAEKEGYGQVGVLAPERRLVAEVASGLMRLLLTGYNANVWVEPHWQNSMTLTIPNREKCRHAVRPNVRVGGADRKQSRDASLG